MPSEFQHLVAPVKIAPPRTYMYNFIPETPSSIQRPVPNTWQPCRTRSALALRPTIQTLFKICLRHTTWHAFTNSKPPIGTTHKKSSVFYLGTLAVTERTGCDLSLATGGIYTEWWHSAVGGTQREKGVHSGSGHGLLRDRKRYLYI